jgi:nicotinate phosphoribosyltransferase
MAWKRRFFIATEEDILAGKVTDVYFERTRSILLEKGVNPRVYGEVTASGFPESWPWAILAGVEETLNLLESLPVTVRAMPEGSLIYPGEPVLTIEGRYDDFGHYETSFLGFLCQSSGVATKAARIKKAARGKPVYSFGARRMHPAIAPAIERSAFIGGCDGVAAVISAEAIDEPPVGTMSHAFIISFGDPATAYKAFDELMPPEIKRIALIDTYEDEKFGAITAAEALGDALFAVRLDTPGSRRGNFRAIIEEVKWELSLRGYKDVRIFVSGGLDEDRVSALSDCADAFGVGTAISNARVIDFAFDIVEREGEPCAKRGKKGGRKQVFECPTCLAHTVTPEPIPDTVVCTCGSTMTPLLATVIANGSRIGKAVHARHARERALSYLSRVST